MNKESVEWQTDYAYLEQAHINWYGHYPPLCGITDVIKAKNAFKVKYGLDALIEALKEVLLKTKEEIGGNNERGGKPQSDNVLSVKTSDLQRHNGKRINPRPQTRPNRSLRGKLRRRSY